ncbi:recombinase family protein [Arthrobacter sp. E3]|uniref:recombinase family protein n=1 Tax=Arthrobacter sp. E3 TaxID=517402 RepID=UPI001A94F089|nr:recombinase family protein [Arthrobacter sp. E3]
MHLWTGVQQRNHPRNPKGGASPNGGAPPFELTYQLDENGVADRLEAEGIKTAKGGRWHPSTVKRVLDL